MIDIVLKYALDELLNGRAGAVRLLQYRFVMALKLFQELLLRLLQLKA